MNKNTLRIIYIPQIPMNPYYKEVKSLDEARLVADTLTTFSNFEYLNNIKPDYSDILDLEMLDGDEWVSWFGEYGDDFCEWLDQQETE